MDIINITNKYNELLKIYNISQYERMTENNTMNDIIIKNNKYIINLQSQINELHKKKEGLNQMVYSINVDKINLIMELDNLKNKYNELRLMHDAAIILKKMKK